MGVYFFINWLINDKPSFTPSNRGSYNLIYEIHARSVGRHLSSLLEWRASAFPASVLKNSCDGTIDELRSLGSNLSGIPIFSNR